MLTIVKSALLWTSAIGCGMIAGVYFIFSASVMTSLSRADAETAVRVFNLTNEDIVRSLFIPLFLVTSLAAALLALLSVLRWGDSSSALILIGSLVYLAGMFVVTVAINVPLNEGLARVDPSAPGVAATWARFAEAWVMWNHVRALASIIPCVIFTVALTVA